MIVRPRLRSMGWVVAAAILAAVPATTTLRLTSSASGTTWYVDKNAPPPGCSDTTNTGTSASSPFCTIGKAVSVVQPGDTVEVMPGTYNEAVNYSIPSSGRGTVSFHGTHNGQRAVIGCGSQSCSGLPGPGVYIHNASGSVTVVFDGFEVANWGGYGIQVANTGASSSCNTNASTCLVTISHNYVHDNSSHGIQVGPGSGSSCATSGVWVDGNISKNNHFHGIHLYQACANRITDNYVASNANGVQRVANGIDVDAGSSDNLIDANLAYKNEDSGIQVYGSDPAASGLSGPTAAFTLTVVQSNPLQVSLDPSLSSKGSYPIAKYMVDWGDNSTDTSSTTSPPPTFNHTYAAPPQSSYVVTLMVTDNTTLNKSIAETSLSGSSPQNATTTAPTAKLVAYAGCSNVSTYAPTSMCVTADASGSVGGTTFTFTFNNGNPISSSANKMTFTYSSSPYTVKVNVADSANPQQSAEVTATIVPSIGNVVTRNVSIANGDHGFDTFSAPLTTYTSNDSTLNYHRGISIDGGSPASGIYDSIASTNAQDPNPVQSNQCTEIYVAPSGSVNGFAADSDVVFPSPASCKLTSTSSQPDYPVIEGTTPYQSLTPSPPGMSNSQVADPQLANPASVPSPAPGTAQPALDLNMQPAGTSPAVNLANAADPHFPGTDPTGASLTDIGVYQHAAPTPAPPPSQGPGQGSTPPPVAPAHGYWEVASDGGIFTFGNASFYGSMGGRPLNAPIVGMAATPDGGGYWMVASDGGIFTFGNAQFYGSMGGRPLNAPIVGMAATPDGGGYWMVASDGGIFSFGNAQFYGSMGGHPLNAPIVGMARTPNGKGYWMVASDGGIFTFGTAQFYGSMGGHPLNRPVVGMAATQSGYGYWLVASDGGIFSFGTAHFYGSEGGKPLNAPIVGMASNNNSSTGYWMVASDGGIFSFGTAQFYGSMGGHPLNRPVVGMAATAN